MCYNIFNPATGHPLATRAWAAATLWQRLRGLIGHSLKPGEALLLFSCQAIHTIGMREPIDVVFLNHNSLILHEIHSIKPWRLSRFVWGAAVVIELPAGTLRRSGTLPGHQLLLERAEKMCPPP